MTTQGSQHIKLSIVQTKFQKRFSNRLVEVLSNPLPQLDTIGVIAALAGAGARGLGTVLVKKWQPPVSLMVFTAWQLAIGGFMLLPIALITEGPFTQVTRTNLWGFIYLGLIGTGLAYALWFRGINKLMPIAASYLGLLSPVVATLIGYVFFLNFFHY